jgi:lipoprotein-anchoring transpeptidase ErfK/SrfK
MAPPAPNPCNAGIYNVWIGKIRLARSTLLPSISPTGLPVLLPLPRLAALMLVLTLAACGGNRHQEEPKIVAPQVLPGYEAVTDEGFDIPAVTIEYMRNGAERTEVPYNGPEDAGTIVVDTYARRLYWVEEGGMATRYAIAVGREGMSFRGNGVIGRKEKWPSWQPTANMLRTRPDLYADYAGGLPGGLSNPLGARAMYLYKGGKDTKFRIHGTIDNGSIGHATSAGCIRLFDQDAIDLYERVKIGTKVKVRTLDESIALEGPYMDDAWGRAVPDTPENRAQLEIDLPIAQQEAADREAALLADPGLASHESESLQPPPDHQ